MPSDRARSAPSTRATDRHPADPKTATGSSPSPPRSPGTIKGVDHTSPIRVSGEALARVGHMFEPGRVAFYGEGPADGFAVIGPDLRRKTIAEAQVQAPAPPSLPKPSRIARDRNFAARARAARLQA